jgi:thioredoxin-related protein
MKAMILIVLMIAALITHTVKSEANSGSTAAPGIAFFEGNWNEALEQAKKENKLIFLDVYATWCGPCKQLKANTFSNAEVGGLYNESFINVALDGEMGEGKRIASLYKVRGYPSLLFIDGHGNVITRAVGYHNPSQFIRLGKNVLEK